ncbi:MAG: TonB-dependent receptor, partial [Verrucomicrobiota bacterium]
VAQMQGQTSAPLNETGTDSVERADSEQEITPMLELETLVIKGQKIDRSLQETYDSVGLVTDTQIESLGLRDFRDSLRIIANVQSVSANNGNSGFTIRGINSEGVENPGGNARPLAALIIDGAPQSFEGIRRGARGVWDVESIEVYRGPQSTLQGRNALAGAIIVETKSPTDFWEGALKGESGQQDRVGGAFMLSGPVYEDELTFRIAGERVERELGTEFNDPIGEILDDEIYKMLRAKLRYEPNQIDGLGFQFTYSDVRDRPAVPAVNRDNPFDRELDVGDSNAEVRENDVTSYIFDSEFEMLNGGEFKSTTNFTFTDAKIFTPPSTYFRDEIREDSDFTQDLQFAYQPNGEKGFSFLIGAFYGLLSNERESFVQQQIGIFDFIIQDLDSETDIENYAIYSEMTVPITADFRITAGLRYDWEQFETNIFYRNVFGDPINESYAAEDTYNAFLPKLSFIYDLNADQSVAFTISRGYRAGFAEPDATVDSNLPIRLIDPEYLWSYDLAYRSEWWEGLLITNINFFYYDWEDMQVSRPNPRNNLLQITENAGESKAWGGEIEIYSEPVSEWLIGVSLGYIKTEFVEFKEVSGNEFPLAPSWSASVWTRREFLDNWYVAGDVAYIDDFFGASNIVNSKLQEVSGYMLANLSFGYERNYWSINAHVRNLFDKEYVIGRDQNAGVYVGDPRTLTIEAILRF